MCRLPDVISAQGLAGCVADGCGKPLVARGRCRKHYTRWWKATRGGSRPPALNLKAKTPEQRFWEKVDRRGPDDCWPWTPPAHRSGHGEFFVSPERGKVQAHSYALELTTGTRPADREACHHCDNPPCCNPAHLYWGTRQQNVDDMYARGRARVGSQASGARFTEAQIQSVRERYAAGVTQTALAAELATSTGHISHIVNGRLWKHAGGPIATPGVPRPRQPKE